MAFSIGLYGAGPRLAIKSSPKTILSLTHTSSDGTDYNKRVQWDLGSSIFASLKSMLVHRNVKFMATANCIYTKEIDFDKLKLLIHDAAKLADPGTKMTEVQEVDSIIRGSLKINKDAPKMIIVEGNLMTIKSKNIVSNGKDISGKSESLGIIVEPSKDEVGKF